MTRPRKHNATKHSQHPTAQFAASNPSKKATNIMMTQKDQHKHACDPSWHTTNPDVVAADVCACACAHTVKCKLYAVRRSLRADT